MHRFLFVLAILVPLIGCEHRPETGESIAEVCHAKNDGKLKTVSGYIGASPVATSCTTTCNLKLRPQRVASGKEIDVTFVLGTGNNELEEPPKEFTDKDILIKDFEGKGVHGGDVVRITGRLSVNTREGDVECTIAGTKVEGLRGLL